MHRNKLLRAWIPCVLWMAVIFTMSAMTGEASGEQSGMVARLAAFLLSLFSQTVNADLLESIIRKGAHMTEFALLFLLYCRALFMTTGKRYRIPAFAMTVLYAATDELHQLFVPGRGASPVDVLIDAGGALIAWAILLVIAEYKKDV